MSPTAPLLTHESVVEFWRRRFRRQRHVNAGVRSLLRKYGAASSTRGLATDFLLTLMGNLVASDSCLYLMSADRRILQPLVAFGSTPLDALSPVPAESAFAQIVGEGGPPRLLNSLPRAATDDRALRAVSDRFRLLAPLHFENRLQGVVFLGEKVSGAAFTDNDIELLEALCAATAAVFQYMQWRQMAFFSADQSARLLSRCQQVADGVADHLEHSLNDIDRLIACGTGDSDSRLEQVSQRAATMRYLLHSLRMMANDPSVLDTEVSEQYDAAEAVQSAVMCFRPKTPTSYSLSFRHEFDDGRQVVAVDRATVEAVVCETLYSLFDELDSGVDSLGVHIDRVDGLPAKIGSTVTEPAEPRPMLRVRIEGGVFGDDATAGSDDAPEGMRMLADNLETFHTVRDAGPSQNVLLERGGAVIRHTERASVVYLLYIPLALV
jgi:hypothetical protein